MGLKPSILSLALTHVGLYTVCSSDKAVGVKASVAVISVRRRVKTQRNE